MGVNSLPKTVTRQRRDCDLNPGPTQPESSTLITQLPSHPLIACSRPISFVLCFCVYADFSYTLCCRMFKSRRYNCAVNARMTVAVCVPVVCQVFPARVQFSVKEASALCGRICCIGASKSVSASHGLLLSV